jgi:hypothetical protein
MADVATKWHIGFSFMENDWQAARRFGLQSVCRYRADLPYAGLLFRSLRALLCAEYVTATLLYPFHAWIRRVAIMSKALPSDRSPRKC